MEVRVLSAASLRYPAKRFLPLSSRGLGRRPLTAETGVRIPVAVLKSPLSGAFSLGQCVGRVADARAGPSAGPVCAQRFQAGPLWSGDSAGEAEERIESRATAKRLCAYVRLSR